MYTAMGFLVPREKIVGSEEKLQDGQNNHLTKELVWIGIYGFTVLLVLPYKETVSITKHATIN